MGETIKIKALTIQQPYASAIGLLKGIETRDWKTGYRGPLGIHAGKQDALEQSHPLWREIYSALLRCGSRSSLPDFDFLPPHGAVIGVCRLKDVVRMTGENLAWISETELRWGYFALGRYAWVLRDFRPFDTPIPARGFPGLWDWDCPAEYLQVT